MPSDFKLFALVVSATLAAACSGTPRTSTPRTDEPAVGGAAAPAGAVDASLVKEGYSVLRRHGQVLYCRTEVITGNRIATRICLTVAQIQDQKQDLAKSKDLLNGPALGRCVGSTCAH